MKKTATAKAIWLRRRSVHFLKFTLLLMTMLSMGVLNAQNNPTNFSGVVKSKTDGQPIPGVSVTVKGTTAGTITDIDGKFTVKTTVGSTLVFSFIGMQTTEMLVNSTAPISVTMEDDVIGLDQVVVVGYGSVERKQITTAVTQVKAEDFNEGHSTEALSVLEGKVAGLTFNKSFGADPNEESTLALRGITSLRGASEPLIIIDGVPASLSTIDENDIENISVLKDGSAAAIYGTRATNGVVLITTKSGKMGKVSIEYNNTLSHRQIANDAKVLTADAFLNKRKELGVWDPTASEKDPLDYEGNTNWADEIANKQNFEQQHSLAFGSATENTAYRFSMNYQDADDLIKEAYKEKLLLRGKISQKSFNNHLNTQVVFSYSNTDRRKGNHDDFSRSLEMNPTYHVTNEDGTYFHPQESGAKNPIGDIYQTTMDDRYRTMNGSFRNEVNFFDGLKGSVTASAQQISNWYGRNYSLESEYAQEQSKSGITTKEAKIWYDKQIESVLEYKKVFDKHNVNLLGGHSWEEKSYENMKMENFDYDTDVYSIYDIGPGTALEDGDATMESSKTVERLIGFVGRLVYSYDSKYLLTASVRRDGSSKFGKENRWGTFPSVSAGWVLSNEEFIQNMGLIDYLKLRIGYGVTGNSGVPPYRSQMILDNHNYYWNGSTHITHGPNVDPNPELRWETKKEYNLGVDFTLFNGKLNGTLDVFDRETNDLLYDYAVPSPPYFFGKLFANGGNFSSKGIELALDGEILKTANIKWTGNMTVTYGKNEIGSFSSEQFKADRDYFDIYQVRGGFAFRYQEGSELGDFYGYRYDGYDEETGAVKFKDLNNDGVIDDSDKEVIGNGIPDLILNFGTKVEYKGFDLALQFRSYLGYDVANIKKLYRGIPNELLVSGNNVLDNTFKGDSEHFRGTVKFNDYYVEKGDFLKLDRITLGYNFPVSSIDFIERARIFGSVNNVFTLTSYSGVTPDLGIQKDSEGKFSDGLMPGIDPGSYYPDTRLFTIGVSMKF
jgi:TonB-linked SusC/RagA family outer membrane protein